MRDLATIEARLDEVERGNRRLKMALAAVVLLLAAIPLVGAVMPQEIPDVIEARGFRVLGEDGTARVMLNSEGIAYSDEEGTIRAAMTDLGIFFVDETGTPRSELGADAIIWQAPGR